MEGFIIGILVISFWIFIIILCLCCVIESDTVKDKDELGFLGRCGSQYCGRRFPCCICSTINDWYNICIGKEPDDNYWLNIC